jgi:hypothetical protein
MDCSRPFRLGIAAASRIANRSRMPEAPPRNTATGQAMGPLGLSDSQMHELMQAAQSVPSDLRHIFLQRVADELRGKPLGEGLVHRVAFAVAKTLAWDADRTAQAR